MANQNFISANISATNKLSAPNQFIDSNGSSGDQSMIMCNGGSGAGVGVSCIWATAENNMYISKNGAILHATDTNGSKAMVVNSNLLYYDIMVMHKLEASTQVPQLIQLVHQLLQPLQVILLVQELHILLPWLVVY
jgi:hypothetical protein